MLSRQRSNSRLEFTEGRCDMLTKIGLDLGYANITLSDMTSDIYREPSVALVDKESRRIVSVGKKALSGGDEGDSSGLLVRPFKSGLLFDKAITEGIISHAINAVLPAERIRVAFAVPSDILPKQERELADMLRDAGVEECFFVNRALAALIGAGYSPNMSAVAVDVGASSTEVAVVHKGSILYQKRTAIGGEDFDKAVRQYIMDQGDVNVSLYVAKSIKEKLGAVWQGKPEETIDIEGTLSLTGNRVKMTISGEDIVGVFEKPLHALLTAVSDGVQKIPAECVEEVFKNGIVLTGGGAELYGLDIMMNRVFDIPVVCPDSPIDCVAKGLSRINNIIPTRVRGAGKNITAALGKYYESTK